MLIRKLDWKNGKLKLPSLQMRRVNICDFDAMLREKEIRPELEVAL